MPMTLDRVIERASKIRLSGGIVGRVCTVLIVACVSLAAIGVLTRNQWIMGGAIVAILVLALPLLWRIITFAEKNPGVAILDGAQFLKHEQLRLASKDRSDIVILPHTPKIDPSPTSVPIDPALLDKPDLPAPSTDGD